MDRSTFESIYGKIRFIGHGSLPKNVVIVVPEPRDHETMEELARRCVRIVDLAAPRPDAAGGEGA